MKCFFFAFFVFLSLTLYGQAKPESLPPVPLEGTVVSFEKNDNTHRKHAVLKVSTAQGGLLTLRLLATTKVRDGEGKDLGLEKVTKGQKITGKYTPSGQDNSGDLGELIFLK